MSYIGVLTEAIETMLARHLVLDVSTSSPEPPTLPRLLFRVAAHERRRRYQLASFMRSAFFKAADTRCQLSCQLLNRGLPHRLAIKIYNGTVIADGTDQGKEVTLADVPAATTAPH